VKQIVAIPIVQTSSASIVSAGPGNLIVSPMKGMRTYSSEVPGGGGGGSGLGRTIKIGSPRAVPPGGYVSGQVSLVKPTSALQLVSVSSGTATTVHVATNAQSATHCIQSVHNYPASSSSSGGGSLNLTPQKQRSMPAPSFQNIKFEAVKRQQDFDPLEASDAKRRKTDKGVVRGSSLLN
jgi:hypothetical protein